jgi:hypothetical protein
MTGWNMPPGCTYADLDRAFGEEGPCSVCGQTIDDCLCPECPHCGSVGDPVCYDGGIRCDQIGTIHDNAFCFVQTKHVHYPIPPHGLVRSEAQIASRAALDRALEEDAKAEALWADAEYLFDHFGLDSITVQQMSDIERDCWVSLARAMPEILTYSADCWLSQ